MKLSQPLSLPPHCYAGPLRVNVSDFSKDIHEQPGVYLEFQEGCGYDPRELTPQEARAIAYALNLAADKTEEDFGQKPSGPITMEEFCVLDEQGEFYFQD